MERSQQRALRLPLPADELAELFAVLEVLLLRRGCEGRLAIAERWLTGGGHDVPRGVAWLQARGGFCDCEVLFNVAPKVSSTLPRRN